LLWRINPLSLHHSTNKVKCVIKGIKLVRDHRALSTTCDVIMALTSEVRLPIRTAACPFRAEPCGC
jgi:hypothetical protein